MKRYERGQGLVEYALILVLVSIVIIAMLVVLGPQIDTLFQEITDKMAGVGTSFGSIRESDPFGGEANIMSGTRQTTLEFDDVGESIEMLWEEAAAQEESLREGADLILEAAVEGFEVLIDYADDINEPVLSEALSQLVQDIKEGNLDAVPDDITLLGTELVEFPQGVWTAVSLKMAPSLTDSCETVAGAYVSQDTIDAARQALEQLGPDHPGAAEAHELLNEAEAIIVGRNDFIGLWLEDACGY
jgi:pilus assembly protein Flp/PilA